MCVDLLVRTQVFWLLSWNPLSLRRREKFNTCGHCQSATFLGSLWTLCLFGTTPISDESGNLLNMIMDVGAKEHVVSLAESLGESVLKPAQVRLRGATGDELHWSFWQFYGPWMVR